MMRYLRKSPLIVYIFRLVKRVFNYFSRILFYNSKLRNERCNFNIGYKNIFFGYYDKSPFNNEKSNLMILHGNNQNAWQKPKSSFPTSIILFDLKRNIVVKKVDKTYAWNWQQGSRVHWINSNKVIYNMYNEQNDTYYSKIYDINLETYMDLPYPVQDSYKNYILSISYEDLTDIRPDYGYNAHKKGNSATRGQIIYYDFINKNEEVLLDRSDITQLIMESNKNLSLNNLDKVKINHCMISPEGDKFIYLLRYFYKGQRHTDTYLYELKRKVNKLIIKDSGVSHYNWINNNEVIFTAKIDGEFGYNVINLSNLKVKNILNYTDGHPTMINCDKFITDTYSDNNNVRRLMIYNNSNNSMTMIKEYIEPIIFQGVCRIDLHPSLSFDKKYIQVDYAHRNKRKIDIIKMEEDLIE